LFTAQHVSNVLLGNDVSPGFILTPTFQCGYFEKRTIVLYS